MIRGWRRRRAKELRMGKLREWQKGDGWAAGKSGRHSRDRRWQTKEKDAFKTLKLAIRPSFNYLYNLSSMSVLRVWQKHVCKSYHYGNRQRKDRLCQSGKIWMGTKQRHELPSHCKTCGLAMMSQQIIVLLDTWDQRRPRTIGCALTRYVVFSCIICRLRSDQR